MSNFTDEILERFRKFIDKDDMSDYVEPPGIGIAWLWKLPDTHPFFKGSVTHDEEYNLMRAGTTVYPTSEIPDFNFFCSCIRGAAEQRTVLEVEKYLAEARFFYGLCRTWGIVMWKAKGLV